MAVLNTVTDSLTNVGTTLRGANPVDIRKAPRSAKNAAGETFGPMGDSIAIVFSSMTLTILLWDLPDRDSWAMTIGDLLLRGGAGLAIGVVVARLWAFGNTAGRLLP